MATRILTKQTVSPGNNVNFEFTQMAGVGYLNLSVFRIDPGNGKLNVTLSGSANGQSYTERDKFSFDGNIPHATIPVETTHPFLRLQATAQGQTYRIIVSRPEPA